MREKQQKMAYNFIHGGWALGLQSVVAMAGYILPTSKLETEKLHLALITKESNLLTFPCY